MAKRLLLATNNAGKAAEYRALLEGCGWELVTPRDLGLSLEVEEAGGDYAENARIKAEAFAKASGLVALADDSGIEVEAWAVHQGLCRPASAARTSVTSSGLPSSSSA